MTTTDVNAPEAAGPSPMWLIALGGLMIVLGVVGLGMAYWLTLAAVIWFGVLTIVGGVAQLFDVVHHKGWRAIVWHLLIAVLYIAAGAAMMLVPVQAAFILTVLIALAFIATGVVRLVMAFVTRGTGATAWLILSAIVSIVLGALLYGTVTPPAGDALSTPEGQLAWVQSWGWVIGLFVSLELLSQGVALLSLGFLMRRGAPAGTPAGTAAA